MPIKDRKEKILVDKECIISAGKQFRAIGIAFVIIIVVSIFSSVFLMFTELIIFPIITGIVSFIFTLVIIVRFFQAGDDYKKCFG